MKQIKFLVALFALVLFTACHNPNSSTSQEVDDETTMPAHEHEGHDNAAAGHGAAMEHADTTHADTTHANTMHEMNNTTTDSTK